MMVQLQLGAGGHPTWAPNNNLVQAVLVTA